MWQSSYISGVFIKPILISPHDDVMWNIRGLKIVVKPQELKHFINKNRIYIAILEYRYSKSMLVG